VGKCFSKRRFHNATKEFWTLRSHCTYLPCSYDYDYDDDDGGGGGGSGGDGGGGYVDDDNDKVV